MEQTANNCSTVKRRLVFFNDSITLRVEWTQRAQIDQFRSDALFGQRLGGS